MSQKVSEEIIRHVKILLDSYFSATGKQLIDRKSQVADAVTLEEGEFVIVSHGTEQDPVLNYGNKTALQLWGMDWKQFVSTPSRYTAEPIRRELRELMLNEAKIKGYFDNYEGVRIASSGNRFEIKGALIWNLVDENKTVVGQAATFSEWFFF